MRVIHVPGKGQLASTALSVGAHGLRWFQGYYGIPYPTQKCDLVALPDFAAGAMENLGCITFRENLLLLDPATATQSEVQVAADVIASGTQKALEPMNAADRKVVHDTVNDIDGVVTSSEGEEPRRRVVIAPAESAS